MREGKYSDDYNDKGHHKSIKAEGYTRKVHVTVHSLLKFLVAEWLRQMCLRDIKCAIQDRDVMILNAGWVNLGVNSTSV